MLNTAIASLTLVTALLQVAGPTPKNGPMAGHLGEMYAAISDDMVVAAREMPEDKYDYRPAPEVRSFGQIVGHLLGSQFIYCAQAKGLNVGSMDRALLTRLGAIRTYAEASVAAPAAPPSKETLVALLDEGVIFCKEAYGSMTDATLIEPIGPPERQGIRSRPLMENLAHNNLHYGNLVTYLRLNGLVPPSTERQKK